MGGMNMNLIEALKVNGKARIKGTYWCVMKEKNDLRTSTGLLWTPTYEELMRDDWEPVKESKIEEGEVMWLRDFSFSGRVYPSGLINFNWSNLVGKTTKIRIEWEE
jgi:hypothetical protein